MLTASSLSLHGTDGTIDHACIASVDTPAERSPIPSRPALLAGVLCLAWLTMAHAASAHPQSPPSATRPHVDAGHGEHDASGPIALEAGYTADILTAARGGLSNDIRYLDNLDLLLTADLERLFGLPRVTAHVYGLYNNGTGFSDDVAGDAQGISNIETGVRAARLYEAWLEYTASDARWSVKGGLYDLNSEFDALEASGLFMGSAHGIGTDIAQSGYNGPSIFPSTSLSLRLQGSLGERLTWRAAALDGVPGDPDNPGRTTVRLSRDDGALLIGELDYAFDGARLLGGLWHYTGSFEEHRHSALADDAVVTSGSNTGLYLRGEALLGGHPEDRSTRGFFRLGMAEGRLNAFGAFFAAGLTRQGLLPARREDESGIALSWAETSSAYRRSVDEGPDCACAGREIVVELTHRIAVNDWLAIQPNLQYVVNPGLDARRSNLVTVGLRFEARYFR